MNQPLGEWPEVPVRSGVTAVLAAADQALEAVRKLRAITALHRCVPYEYLSGVDVCEDCDQVWPCETTRIIEAVPL